MWELTKAEDLAKAGRSMGSFFAKRAEELEKSHGFHKAVAAHHEGLAKEHHATAATHQAAHDALDNDHELKNCIGKAAGHHTAMAGHHESIAKAHHAHADAMKADLDAMKALASDWGGPTVKAATGTPASEPGTGGSLNVATMLQTTSELLMKKTLDSFENDPEVAERIRKFALGQITSALGDKLVPDNVRGVITNFPNVTLVPRAGAPRAGEKTADVPLELEKVLSMGENEE
jgi:hypothetical protein